MADVFVSYSRKDEDAAEELVSLLRAEGWTVWYDTSIAGGHRFRSDIEQELDQARVVVVLWSVDSVQSSWVNAEAEEAARLAKILPVRLDGCSIPLPLRAFQTIDFREWVGDPMASSWLALRETISRLTGPPQGQNERFSYDFVVGTGNDATHASIADALSVAVDADILEPRVYVASGGEIHVFSFLGDLRHKITDPLFATVTV